MVRCIVLLLQACILLVKLLLPDNGQTSGLSCALDKTNYAIVYRSKDISADMWLEELNDAITRATGLDQLGLPQAPLDEEDLTESELVEQQRGVVQGLAEPQLAR